MRWSAVRPVEWAQGGDGVREVHDNILEGIWAGLRNDLRRFRGGDKTDPAPHVAVFLWSYTIKMVTDGFLRTLLGVRDTTDHRP